MCLKQTLDIVEILFVVYGTYLLSRQLFIETVIEQFMRKLLSYQKYEDIPILFRFAGWCYGFTKDNWINAGTGIGDERPISKLSDPAASFKGFLCICISAILHISAILLF